MTYLHTYLFTISLNTSLCGCRYLETCRFASSLQNYYHTFFYCDVEHQHINSSNFWGCVHIGKLSEISYDPWLWYEFLIAYNKLMPSSRMHMPPMCLKEHEVLAQGKHNLTLDEELNLICPASSWSLFWLNYPNKI